MSVAVDELIEAAENLCRNLELASTNETKFCADVCMHFEQYSWELYKMASNMREIKQIYGA